MRVKRAVIIFRRRVPIDRPLGLWSEQAQALMLVQRCLKRRGISFTTVERGAFRGTNRADLAITVGGDGTFLTASHHLKETPLVGINATPRHSIAFFSATTAENLPTLLDRLESNRLRPKKLTRLEVRRNSRPVPELILNEILFCHPSPAGTARYYLTVGRHSEEHRSSGVLVGPAAGSEALIHSAGGKYLSLFSDRIQLVVREPYEPRGTRYRLKRMILPPTARIRIRSKMVRGRLFIDGSHLSYGVRFGDQIEICQSRYPLYIVK